MPESPTPVPDAPVPGGAAGSTERRPWYKLIPAPVWGLVALGVGMTLGSFFPEQLGFIGLGVKGAFRYVAAAAPYIIYFTLVAAIGDMLQTGSAARFAFWVTVAYTLTTVVAGLTAILILWPLFQLDFAGGAVTSGGNGFLGMLSGLMTLAVTSPPFIAIIWAVVCAIGLHFASKTSATAWFALPTYQVLRRVGVDGVVYAGRGLRYALPAILFAIGVFIPTGVAQSIAESESTLAGAQGASGFADLSSLEWYFLSLAAVVLILAVFFFATTFAVCKYTGFSVKRFFKDYFLYVYPFAWATASSAATIPLNLERAENGLGVRKEVRDFIVPLGATVNLDGTMIAAFVLTVIGGIIVGYQPTVVELAFLLIPLTVVTVGVPGIPGGVALIAPGVITSFLPIPNAAAFGAIFLGFSIGLSDQFRTGVNSCDNGLISLVFEKLYDKHFAKKRGVQVVDGETPAPAPGLVAAEDEPPAL